MMNNKGFMMAEVVVVSAIVMITLAGLYMSYVKIYAIYNERINYYDVNTLYQLSFYRDVLTETKEMDKSLLDYEIDKNDIVYINDIIDSKMTDSEKKIDLVYLLPVNKLRGMTEINNLNPTFVNYVKYLLDTMDIQTEYMMLLERCSSNQEVRDNNNCKYAYLEVFENETP